MVLGYWLLLLLLLSLLLIPNVSLPLSPITVAAVGVGANGGAVGDGTNDAVVIPLPLVGLVVEVGAVMALR